jgi:DNA repair protein SbcD/Mre11
MKLIHTADWHLGDRLGRIDRTGDIRRNVDRIAGYCHEHDVDVLLVAGDLFSEMNRSEELSESIEHLKEAFLPFLQRGGTIVALTGNHDNETFCQTLRHALTLAAPTNGQVGVVQPGGRFYLATGPTFYQLAGRDGKPVQFLLMPYPTAGRYLDDQAQRYNSLEERNRAVQAAYSAKLRRTMESPRFRHDLPTVFSAHVHAQGAALSNLFRITERESIIVPVGGIPSSLAYVALGHLHQPQCLGGQGHVRYSGSIERLDLGEKNDTKGIVLVDVGHEGLRGAPVCLPLDATPIYEADITIRNIEEDLPAVRAQYPDAASHLVRYHLTYEGNLPSILDALETVFPRWYDRKLREASAPTLGTVSHPEVPRESRSVRETVLDYLRAELDGQPGGEAVEALAETILQEQGQ